MTKLSPNLWEDSKDGEKKLRARHVKIQRLGEVIVSCPGTLSFTIVNTTETHAIRFVSDLQLISLRTDFTKSLPEMLRRSPTTISLTQDDITRYDEARKQKLEAQHKAHQQGSSLENLGTGNSGANGPADKQKARTAEQRIMGR